MARDMGLVRTRANSHAATRRPSCLALSRPTSVRGMSVRPVCWPDTLHSVWPWRTSTTWCRLTGSPAPRPGLAVPADEGVGGAAVVLGDVALGGQLTGDAAGQHLAQLHAPLVERVDVPDRPLGQHLVLVEG